VLTNATPLADARGKTISLAPNPVKTQHAPAEVNIHLRAKAHDRMLVDQAAELLGSNRSGFMMASALKEAKNVILGQTSLSVDNQAFLDWPDAPATQERVDGMNRLRTIRSPWPNE